MDLIFKRQHLYYPLSFVFQRYQWYNFKNGKIIFYKYREHDCLEMHPSLVTLCFGGRVQWVNTQCMQHLVLPNRNEFLDINFPFSKSVFHEGYLQYKHRGLITGLTCIIARSALPVVLQATAVLEFQIKYILKKTLLTASIWWWHPDHFDGILWLKSFKFYTYTYIIICSYLNYKTYYSGNKEGVWEILAHTEVDKSPGPNGIYPRMLWEARRI